MGAFFKEPEEGEQTTRVVAEGKAAARSAMADAVDNCGTLSSSTSPQMGLAVEYLTQLSVVRNIGLSNGARWNAAMQNYAPSAQRLMPAEGKPDGYARALIAAGAYSNGVPQMAEDEGEDSQIIAYLLANADLQKALANISN